MSLRDATIDRERRDLVSHQVMDESRLIRFVAGPDGQVVPDLGRKLPGRGLWVEASPRLHRDGGQEERLHPRGQDPSERPGRLGRHGRATAGAALSGPAGSCPARRRAYLWLRKVRRQHPFRQGRLGDRGRRRLGRRARKGAGPGASPDRQGVRRIHGGRFEFGPWAGKCDTRRPACGRTGRSLDHRGRTTGWISAASPFSLGGFRWRGRIGGSAPHRSELRILAAEGLSPRAETGSRSFMGIG